MGGLACNVECVLREHNETTRFFKTEHTHLRIEGSSYSKPLPLLQGLLYRYFTTFLKHRKTTAFVATAAASAFGNGMYTKHNERDTHIGTRTCI
jgi:hypothetical protein